MNFPDGSLPYFDQIQKKCVLTCDPRTVLIESDKVCKNCKNYGEFFFNGACIVPCPRNTISTTTFDFFTCSYCPAGQYVLRNECVLICGPGMAPDFENVCVDCQADEYDYLNKCVKTCIPLTIIEERSCVNCKLKNPVQYYYKGRCTPEVPIKTMVRDANFNEMVGCQEVVPPYFTFGNGCVKKCPDLTATFENEYECFNWLSLRLYYYNGYIVNQCPVKLNKHADSDNVCKFCTDMMNPEKNEFCMLVNKPTVDNSQLSNNYYIKE